MSGIVEPGTVIRAVITDDEVKLLAERLYGISVLELTELNGYDDRNFKITEDPNMKNPLIPEPCEHGYVLKIMNSLDSKNAAVVDAQNEMMNFLSSRQVVCPTPVRNVYSHLYSIESISGRQHAVRLLRYVPGTLLKDVPMTPPLLYKLGEFVAMLDHKLEGFNHSGLENREFIWMLTKVPELDKFKYVIKDADKLDLAEEVIEEFKYAVVPQLDELQKGVIHGDINEMNILVTKPEGKSEYDIAGILDLGDVQRGPLVCELATCLAYVAAVTGDPRRLAPVLAGYSVTRRLPENEYRLLKTLICARLVQSLIIGAYTIEQDPKNTYVTSTEKANGWELLRKLRKTPPSEDGDITDWKTMANEYLTRS